MSEQPPPGAGIGRVLVLLGAALALVVSGLVSFVVLLFGPVLTHRPGLSAGLVLGVVCYVLLTVAAIAAAVALVLRRGGTGRTAAAGCTTLVLGAALATGVLLIAVTVR